MRNKLEWTTKTCGENVALETPDGSLFSVVTGGS